MSYEPKDASPAVIGTSVGVIAFLVAGSIGVSAWYYHARYAAPDAPAAALRQTSFQDGPRQQLGILVDRAEVKEAADQRLQGYRWIDRDAGLAHIPIERAMELTVSGVKPAPGPKEPGQVP